MSYTAFETSLELGTPIELYELVQGLQRWNLISGANAYSALGVTYAPSPIKRDRIKQTSDTFKDALKLTFPRDNAFASQFLGFAPDIVTTLTIRRGHYGDADSEFIVYWKGRVIGAKASGNEIIVECESLFTSVKRPGLRARFEYNCRHSLYGVACGVNQEAYKLTGTVLSVSGVTVEVQGVGGFADGHFTGGIITLPSGIMRFVTNHVGGFLTIARPIASLIGNTEVSVYPGCDHAKATCDAKFNNLPNFGGFPYIPGRNPFDGSSIV